MREGIEQRDLLACASRSSRDAEALLGILQSDGDVWIGGHQGGPNWSRVRRRLRWGSERLARVRGELAAWIAANS